MDFTPRDSTEAALLLFAGFAAVVILLSIRDYLDARRARKVRRIVEAIPLRRCLFCQTALYDPVEAAQGVHAGCDAELNECLRTLKEERE